MGIVLSALSPVDFDLKPLRQILEQVLNDHRETGDIVCIFTDNAQIQQLNRAYRSKDAPTDVLSFDLRDPTHPDYVGDIYISLEQAQNQARDVGRSVDEEVFHLAIHGTLHLLGYEHDTDAGHARMQAREKYYLERLSQHQTV